MGISAEEMLRDRLPETGPADTPAQAGTPERAAPAGETRTYAGGKYKTVEELENAYQEAQRKISEYGERVSRLESLILSGGAATVPGYEHYGIPAQPTPAQPTAPTVPEYGVGDQTWVSREEAARIAREEAARIAAEHMRIQAQQAQLSAEQTYWRDEFFRRYPDLKEETPLVAGVTTEVVQRYSHLQPQAFRAMIPSMLEEIATRSRERIAAYVARGKTEAERAAAAQAAGQTPGQSGVVSPPGPAREPSYEERVAEALREEQERYIKARRPLGR
jgi:hypothetical protein